MGIGRTLASARRGSASWATPENGRMLDSKYRCNEILPLFKGDAVHSLQGLEFYVNTLEQLVERECSQEIGDLKRHADQLPEDRRGKFWAWHYPVHWDEVFASQLRSSFVVTLVSLAESHVGMVAEQACEIADTPLTPDDLRSGFERHRKHLQALPGFARPDDRCWNAVYEIRDLRNCIVHANSRIWATKNEARETRLRSLVDRLPGLTRPYDVLELSREFPTHAFRTVQKFILDLYEEAEELCRRAGAWRRDS
jgi:hypothetical protein